MIVKDIEIKEIAFGQNIRQIVKDEQLENLMQTIKDNGLLQAIGLKQISDKEYKILWGNRRLSACKKLGWKTIPAVIYSSKDENMTEEEFIVVNGIENLQQSPNTLFEIGRICKILRKTMSIPEIAVRLGIPKTRVEYSLNEIQRIPQKWQKKIRLLDNKMEKKGDIPVTHAVKVVQLRNMNNKTKDKIFEYLSKNDVTVGKIELVSSLVQSGKSVSDAVKMADKYEVTTVEVIFDKKIYENAVKNFKSKSEFIVHSLNKIYPNIAVKSVGK